MRRIPAVLLLCLGIALAGAAPPRPSPTPTRTPTPAHTPTPAPAASGAPQVTALPIVVVFPFGTSSDIPASNGQKAASLFTEVMNSAGGIDTIDAPGTVKPADYLTYARNVNADYYVTGYMTPLGNGVSLVEQVVSTRSGTMVFGQTAQVQSFEDASAQAVAVHDGIVQQEQSMKAAYQDAQATATATPMPNNQANLGKGIANLAGLFKHKGKSTTTTTAAVVKPDKGVLVAHVNGTVPANNLSSATSELYAALNTYYKAQMTSANGQDLSKEANGICGRDRNNTIATGTVSAKSTRRGLIGTRTEWTFNLDIYTCWGARLAQQTATAGSLKDAITKAVAAYAQAHPKNA